MPQQRLYAHTFALRLPYTEEARVSSSLIASHFSNRKLSALLLWWMWFIHLEYLLLCFAHYLINGIIYAVYHYGWLAYPSAKDRALVKICEDGEKHKKKNITRPMQWKAVTLSALIRDEWRVSRPSCRVSMRLTGMRALVLLFACGMFLFSMGVQVVGGVRHPLLAGGRSTCTTLQFTRWNRLSSTNIPGVL